MAFTDFSAALPAPAHPPANPGYGKRCAPDQCPRGEADFVHLRTREAAIAAYIDRLPEGAAIGYKALAANIADYGQQACGKALNFLSDAGHLRRVKEHLRLEDNSFRWVTHTYFSRTSRDDAWWTAFVGRLHGVDLTELERRKKAAEAARAHNVPAPDVPVRAEPVQPAATPTPAPAFASAPVEPAATPAPAPAPAPAPQRPAPSEAYRILARLGRTEPRMTLSARECAALESLAAEWLARGATPDHLVRSLTAGLPQPLRSPGAIARTRLENKMPPEPFHAPAHVNLAVMVCMTCDVADNVKPLIRGVCLDCREEMAAYDAAEDAGVVIDRVPDTFLAVPAQVNVARRADECRAMAGFKARPIPQQMHAPLGQARAE
ncbi:hypothetical protein [Streptomyces sp. SID3212]|uniref:hypothetical protein n=1 Tax=Streptomyces sp. SID3212 TaxID=2690259 RepID=UPI001369D58C|nr:hypothetical protein [Streptomyces sp. SID3212]